MKSTRKGKAKPAGRRSSRSASAKSASTARKAAAKPARRVAAKAAGKPQAIPTGYSAITPYLIVDNAAGAIDFYKKAFGAREKMRLGMPGGKIGHAELKFGDALVMLADEAPDHNALSPKTVGGTPVTIHLYVKNVDRIVEQAINAGATVMRPVADQFYGDRSGSVRDPYGHAWHVATHTEDVSMKEIARRAQAMASKQAEHPSAKVEATTESDDDVDSVIHLSDR